MNIEDAIDAGYDPRDYDEPVKPMTRRQYLRWIRKMGLPDSGYMLKAYRDAIPSEPPF